MKTQSILSLICIAALFLTSFAVKAQADSFDADIVKMQQVNGAAGMIEAVFGQIVAQLKPSKPDVTDAQWAALKKEVFDVEVAELNKQLIPVYKKHFTQDDVKGIIAFYETPTGKKMAEKIPLISLESMQFSQKWGIGLYGKIQAYLDKQ